MESVYSALIPDAACEARSKIAEILAHFGDSILGRVAKSGCSIRPLRKRELYAEASSALARLGIDVDSWPAPPAGLFVVEERTVYLRSLSPMTIAHEFGHALDCALGNGVYFSGTDSAVREAFANATTFVTPYAASARAYVGVNDRTSHWPSVSRAKLQRTDAVIYGVLDAIFAFDP